MVEVRIPFSRIAHNHDFLKLHHASNYAIKMSEWCKDQGLIMGLDFEWAVWSGEESISFKFMGNGGKVFFYVCVSFWGR